MHTGANYPSHIFTETRLQNQRTFRVEEIRVGKIEQERVRWRREYEGEKITG